MKIVIPQFERTHPHGAAKPAALHDLRLALHGSDYVVVKDCGETVLIRATSRGPYESDLVPRRWLPDMDKQQMGKQQHG